MNRVLAVRGQVVPVTATPLTLHAQLADGSEVTGQSRIARTTGLSRRQIERLFKRHLDCVPKKYYLEMRLRRARELLLQTAMPIMDVTTSCGFKSPPHFSRCYRSQFGHPPSAERLVQKSAVAPGPRAAR